MDGTIYCQWVPQASFTVTTTGGAAPSCTFTAGTRYRTPHEVIARLNAQLGALVTFALTDATGEITVSWSTSPASLTWGDSSLREYLGFADAVILHTTDDNDEPPAGWWHGALRRPWGPDRTVITDDVVGDYGRTTAAQSSGVRETGAFSLWLYRRSADVTTFAAEMEDCYAAADQWAASACTLLTDDGEAVYYVLAPGWEMAPVSLDDVTVYLDVEAVAWPA